MTMLMRETYYGMHEPGWMAPMREPGPYFLDGPYFSPFPLNEAPRFSPYSESPFREPLPRRSVSSIPTFGHFGELPYLVDSVSRPPRSSSSIPDYSQYHEESFHDSPPRPTRSSSSVPLREFRESRPPKQQKVAPEIELRVPMCCNKCEARVRDTLQKVEGVTKVIADRHTSKVTVSGKVDPQVVLKKVQKQKKKADFWTKDIYSKAFIDFIQSKTGRAQPEEEVTSSFHQHVSADLDGDSLHAYGESEHLSSYEEYPERDVHDSYDEDEGGPSQAPYQQDAYIERNRGFYNNQIPSYGPTGSIPPYGVSSSYADLEGLHGARHERPRYEGPGTTFYNFEPSYGAQERGSYYERESRSAYGDYGYTDSYRPSQNYGPSGVSNPNYMKRIITDF